jgi:hypothetical protein
LPPRVGNVTPASGSAKANTNSITASGELRNTVTQAVPTQRSGGTGETRNPASSVPIISAPTAANRLIRSVPKKPST